MAIAIPAVLVGLTGNHHCNIFIQERDQYAEAVSKSLGGFYRAAYRNFILRTLPFYHTESHFQLRFRPSHGSTAIFDGSMNGISYVTNQVSDRIRGFQSGQVQQYAWVFVTGAIALALTFHLFMTV